MHSTTIGYSQQLFVIKIFLSVELYGTEEHNRFLTFLDCRCVDCHVFYILLLLLFNDNMKVAQILLHHHTFFVFPRNITSFFPICNANPSSMLNHETRGISSLHRKRREEKFMYGSMKTKKKKTWTKSANDPNNGVDSELWWQLKLSRSRMNLAKPNHNLYDKDYKGGKNMQHIKLIPKDPLLAYNKDKIVLNAKKGIIKLENSKDIKKIESTCNRERREDKNDNDTVTTKDITNDLKTLKEKNIKLLDIKINNITQFPMFTQCYKKEMLTNEDKLEILSISSEEDSETLYYPSVTKILSATMSLEAQKALALWKMKMIKERGIEKFEEYHKELLNDGCEFHSCIEDTLLGKRVNVPKHIQQAYNSLNNIIYDFEDIKAVESFVSHKDLYYKGKVDCIASYRGKLCAIDWKKSDKDKLNINSMYDAPIQLAAYIGAINSSERYPFVVDCGLIVVGYTNGKPADTFTVSGEELKTYWEKWLAKLKHHEDESKFSDRPRRETTGGIVASESLEFRQTANTRRVRCSRFLEDRDYTLLREADAKQPDALYDLRSSTRVESIGRSNSVRSFRFSQTKAWKRARIGDTLLTARLSFRRSSRSRAASFWTNTLRFEQVPRPRLKGNFGTGGKMKGRKETRNVTVGRVIFLGSRGRENGLRKTIIGSTCLEEARTEEEEKEGII
ncbi:LOW QUALITY PROTEIN: mitochondrial genome maintenance exonuclease 1-like, partial [Vespula squamosa]